MFVFQHSFFFVQPQILKTTSNIPIYIHSKWSPPPPQKYFPDII